MQSRRRGFKEITYSISKAAFEGARKTRVMYASSLNVGQLNGYLAELISQGLINYEPQTKLYYTTAKGRQYLKAYERYAESVEQLNQTESILDEICGGKKTAQARPVEAVSRTESPVA